MKYLMRLVKATPLVYDVARSSKIYFIGLMWALNLVWRSLTARCYFGAAVLLLLVPMIAGRHQQYKKVAPRRSIPEFQYTLS
jgi:hypothetical protein